MATEPHTAVFIRVVNSDGSLGRERAGVEGGALELASAAGCLCVCTSVLGVRWEGSPRYSSQPLLSSSDSEMTFLTSFSYELIVVCKHKLCHRFLLPLCLIRNSS